MSAGCPSCRAGRLRSWRQPLDQIDVGALELIEELAGIARQPFEVAAPPLGVERVEGQRALARAAQAGQDHEPVAWEVDVEIAQVVDRAPRTMIVAEEPPAVLPPSRGPAMRLSYPPPIDVSGGPASLTPGGRTAARRRPGTFPKLPRPRAPPQPRGCGLHVISHQVKSVDRTIGCPNNREETCDSTPSSSVRRATCPRPSC